jgi:xanthine/uracil permease
MWVVREVARLAVRIVVVAAVALAIAGVLSLFSAGSFATNARILCIAIGCVLLAMAGVGSGSNLERYMDQSVVKVAWGTIPGFDTLKVNPEDPTLAPGAAFFCSGLVLIAIGVAAF